MTKPHLILYKVHRVHVNKGYQEIAGQTYYSALYPDKAVAEACVTCHNTHPVHLERYPDKQFELGEVMGGIIINLPVDQT